MLNLIRFEAANADTFNLIQGELDGTCTVCVDLFDLIQACEGRLHFVGEQKILFFQDVVIDFVVIRDSTCVFLQQAVVDKHLSGSNKCDDVADEGYIEQHVPLKNDCSR